MFVLRKKNQMKTKLLFLALILSEISYAQEDKLLDILPIKDGKVNYTSVVSVDSASKDQLYTRAKRWFAEAFKSAQDVIQLDDKESGEIIGKGAYQTSYQATFAMSLTTWVNFKVNISVKDEKYKYEITSFTVKYIKPSGSSIASADDTPIESWNNNREENKKKFLVKVNDFVTSLVKSIEDQMKSNKSSDW